MTKINEFLGKKYQKDWCSILPFPLQNHHESFPSPPGRRGGEVRKIFTAIIMVISLHRYIVISLNRYIVHRQSSIVHRPSSIANRQSSIVISSIVNSYIVNFYIVISLSHLKCIVQVTGPWLKRRILISRCSPGVVARIHSKLNLPSLPFPPVSFYPPPRPFILPCVKF